MAQTTSSPVASGCVGGPKAPAQWPVAHSEFWELTKAKSASRQNLRAIERRLASRLADIGLSLHDVKRDGACQFRALAHQLEYRRVVPNGVSHIFVKKQIVDQLHKWNRDNSMRPRLTAAAYDFSGNIEAYIADLESRVDAWGDQMTLVAAAVVFNVDIVFVSSAPASAYQSLDVQPQDRPEGVNPDRPILTLAHWYECHWSSTRDRKGPPAAVVELLDRLKEMHADVATSRRMERVQLAEVRSRLQNFHGGRGEKHHLAHVLKRTTQLCMQGALSWLFGQWTDLIIHVIVKHHCVKRGCEEALQRNLERVIKALGSPTIKEIATLLSGAARGFPAKENQACHFDVDDPIKECEASHQFFLSAMWRLRCVVGHTGQVMETVNLSRPATVRDELFCRVVNAHVCI